jgi:hypothetical protein
MNVCINIAVNAFNVIDGDGMVVKCSGTGVGLDCIFILQIIVEF